MSNHDDLLWDSARTYMVGLSERLHRFDEAAENLAVSASMIQRAADLKLIPIHETLDGIRYVRPSEIRAIITHILDLLRPRKRDR